MGVSLDTATIQAAARFVDHYYRAPPASERASLLRIEGKTWAMSEVIQPQVALLALTQVVPHKVDIAAKNELVYQHLLGPRQYLALTNRGVHLITKLRPIDQLHDLLIGSSGNETPQLQEFFATYGDDQVSFLLFYFFLSFFFFFLFISPFHCLYPLHLWSYFSSSSLCFFRFIFPSLVSLLCLLCISIFLLRCF